MVLNDIDRYIDAIFAAHEITFSFCNLMVNHHKPLPTIPRLLISDWTCLEKSSFPKFTDGRHGISHAMQIQNGM
jgi:hypothetical protein